MSRASRNSWKSIFYSKWFLILNCIVLIVICYASIRNFYHDYQIQKEIKRFQEQAKMLETKNLETLEILKHVKSQNFIEEKARTEFNLVKPGEKVVVIHGSEKNNQNYGQIAQNMIEQEKVSNPVKWWRYFFGHLTD